MQVLTFLHSNHILSLVTRKDEITLGYLMNHNIRTDVVGVHYIPPIEDTVPSINTQCSTNTLQFGILK